MFLPITPDSHHVVNDDLTVLSVELSFCGPLEYNSWMLEKLCRETRALITSTFPSSSNHEIAGNYVEK